MKVRKHNSPPKEGCPQDGVENSPPKEGCPSGGVENSPHEESGRSGGFVNTKKQFTEILTTINNIKIKRNFVEKLPRNSGLSKLAKGKRKTGILSEVLFWQQVHKGKFHRIDFDRQRIIGNFIVDFYVKALGLVVEIDGSSHIGKEEYDTQRQAFLENLGLKVFRCSDTDIKENIGAVLLALEDFIIKEYCGQKHTNIAIYMHQNQSLKDAIDAIKRTDLIPLDLMNGEVYSKQKLKEFLKEEMQHGAVVVRSDVNESLSTMSSGQQSRALLLHLLSKDIDYLILDDVFSNLDKENVLSFQDILKKYSTKICFIQLAYRREDILDWIEKVYQLNDGEPPELNPLDISSTKEATNKFSNIAGLFSYQKIAFSESAPLIVLDEVNVSYGEKEVLKNFSWTVHQGDFWQISGPNGSGKSTLLSMIYGDNVKAYGQNVFLFGKRKGSGESVWEIKEKIGYFAASTTVLHYRNDTVQNMIIGGLYDSIGLYQMPSLLDQKKSLAWLDAMHLTHLKDKPFTDQTIGIQRMIMIARAMIKEPILLILDEPTAGLDDENARLVVDLISSIASSKVTTILYVSHREEVGLEVDQHLRLG